MPFRLGQADCLHDPVKLYFRAVVCLKNRYFVNPVLIYGLHYFATKIQRLCIVMLFISPLTAFTIVCAAFILITCLFVIYPGSSRSAGSFIAPVITIIYDLYYRSIGLVKINQISITQ